MITFTRAKCLSCALLVAALAVSAGQIRAQSYAGGSVTVRAPSEGGDLAEGFAEAFKLMTRQPIFISYSDGEHLIVVSGVKSLRAMGAVLRIESERGGTLVIPATRVLSLTDEQPK
jgi:hypothetical protein